MVQQVFAGLQRPRHDAIAAQRGQDTLVEFFYA